MTQIAVSDESEERFVIRDTLDRIFKREKFSTREIAVLHFVDGMTLGEVAKEMGLSQSGVRKRLRELRVRIRIPYIRKKLQATQVRKETRPRSKAVRRLLYASPVLVSALVFLFIVVLKAPVSQDTPIKGLESIDMTKSQLLIYRKVNDEVHLIRNGEAAHKGDLLQVAYVSAGDPFGVIFSIDGSGAVTLHYPDDNLSSTALQPNKQVPLKTSYELDDALEFERFFFITARSEIDVNEILGQAERLAENPERAREAALDLPQTYGQYSVLIKKGE